MSEIDDSLPRLLAGRYYLEARLGHGSAEVVYRATDLTMHRAVAVKLVRHIDGVALDAEIAGRLLREAKATVRTQHEHIIEVFELGQNGSELYFVMEWLDGESLSARLRRQGKVVPTVAVHIARQICAALHAAHTGGSVHPDLLPANVMLIERGGDPNFVKLLDFAFAKSSAQDRQTRLTEPGTLIGSVEYMAPEQIMGRGGDARSDVYSLGVVLYRMLSGLAPFRAISVPAVIHAHLNTQPMPVVEVAPGVPGSLDIVVQRCLAKRPDDRYPTMAVLSDVLRAAMAPLDEERASVPFPASDPYTDERTDVTRPCIAAIVPMRERTSSDSFEEATARMDRAHFGRYGAGVSDEVTHTDQLLPRACAMCRTVNPAHARACSACGVSLEADEQDAVRVRVVPASPASAASSSALEAGWRAPAPMLPRRSLWERLLTWLGFRRR